MRQEEISSQYIAQLAPNRTPNLAGRYHPDAVGSCAERVRKSDLKPGFKFRLFGSNYSVAACQGTLLILDSEGQMHAKVIPCGSWKGFNVETVVLGKPVRTFIYFNEMRPIY